MIKNQKIIQEILILQKELGEKEKKIKKFLIEREKIEEAILGFSKVKSKLKEVKFLKEKNQIIKEIAKIEKEEKEIKLGRIKIEEQEKREKNWLKKREIEKLRWAKELKERTLERKKWKLEDKLKEQEREIREAKEKLEQGNLLKGKLEKNDEEIKKLRRGIRLLKEKVEEQEQLEEGFKEAWESYLGGDISLALEKLKKIQEKLSEKIEEEPREEAKEGPGKKIDQKKREFFESFEHHQKDNTAPALESLGEVLKKVEEKPLPKKELLIKEEEEFPVEKKEKTASLMVIKEAIEEELAISQEEERAPLVVVKKTSNKEVPIQERKEITPLVVIKEAPKEELLSEFKEKLKKEREISIQKEGEKLRRIREELEERQKETLKAMIEGRELGLQENKTDSLKKKLQEKREELEKTSSLEDLTEEERGAREETIKFLREKVGEGQRKIGGEEVVGEKGKDVMRSKKLKILEDTFEQALTLYNEKEFEKAKKTFSIVKEQLIQGEKLGLFLNVKNMSIYTKTVYFSEKAEEGIKRIKKETDKILKEKIEEGVEEKIRKMPMWKEFLNLFLSTNKISKFFQQSLFSLPSIGLDLSDHSIELLRLDKKGEVLIFARQVLTSGIIIDGRVVDLKAFSKTLALLLKGALFPPFRSEKQALIRAVVSLPESSAYTIVFRLKSPEKLYQQVREKIEMTFPLPLNKIYFDYVVCGKDRFGKIKVVCVVVEKKIINALVTSFRVNGIEPLVFEVSVFSTRRALLPQLPLKERVGILDIGAHITSFNILDEKGFVEFSASLSCGGDNFQTKVADLLSISKERAKELIIEKGFQKDPIKEILGKEMERIVGEMKGALGYYQEIFKEKVKRVILTGGGVSFPGITEILKKSFPDTKIEILNPFTKTKSKKPLPLKESLFFANALGLAKRAISKDFIEGGINLLPEQTIRREREVYLASIRKKIFLIKISVSIVIILLLVFLFYIFLK